MLAMRATASRTSLAKGSLTSAPCWSSSSLVETRRLAPYTQTLLGLLMEAWVTPQHQRDLTIVTGKDRDGWLEQRPP